MPIFATPPPCRGFIINEQTIYYLHAYWLWAVLIRIDPAPLCWILMKWFVTAQCSRVAVNLCGAALTVRKYIVRDKGINCLQHWNLCLWAWNMGCCTMERSRK